MVSLALMVKAILAKNVQVCTLFLPDVNECQQYHLAILKRNLLMMNSSTHAGNICSDFYNIWKSLHWVINPRLLKGVE